MTAAQTPTAPEPKAPRKARKKFKTTAQADSVSDALGWVSEIEALKDEMEEWKDSLDDAGMDHLDKYAEVEEAFDVLENAQNELEEAVAAFEGCGALADTLAQEVSYSVSNNYGKKSDPRWMRCGNVVAGLEAAQEALSNMLCSGFGDTSGIGEDDLATLQDYVGTLEEQTGNLDSICFPGMY